MSRIHGECPNAILSTQLAASDLFVRVRQEPDEEEEEDEEDNGKDKDDDDDDEDAPDDGYSE